MTWALWLAVPIGATTLAALAVWARGWAVARRSRPLDTPEAMQAHRDYLDALSQTPRSRDRGMARETVAGGGSATADTLPG